MGMLEKKIRDITFQNIKQVFEETCKNTLNKTSIINKISLDDIPESSMKMFEGYSARFIPLDKYFERNFDSSFVIDSEDYSRTFVVMQKKNYESGNFELQIYISTLDVYANPLGHGEIRYNPQSTDEYFKNKPFAGFTSLDNKLLSDDELFVKMRLEVGLNQLNMMNALCCTIYGWPMYSDTITLPEEKPVWKHLLKKGKVSLFKEGTEDRYVFNTFISLTKYDISMSVLNNKN
jgi:hypothetical protein